jgi:nucleoside-diphosphate-sugar epimerase
VLVVGGTSFIGRHLLARRSAMGLTTWATCRDRNAAPSVDGVTWLPGDLTTAHVDRGWPARIDTVISLAQSRSWRQFPEGAADVFAVNVEGAFKTAEYARQAGARQLIYASSGSVYGASSAPIDLSSPRHFYVAAKLAAEALLSGYRSTMQVIVLRLFVPYGEFQDPGMLMPQIVRKVSSGEPVILDRDDGLLVNPVAVDDVVETIARCLALDTSVTMDVAGPETLRLKTIAELIGGVIDREPVFQLRDAAPAHLVGSTAALEAAINWSPRTSPADGFARWLAHRRVERPRS